MAEVQGKSLLVTIRSEDEDFDTSADVEFEAAVEEKPMSDANVNEGVEPTTKRKKEPTSVRTLSLPTTTTPIKVMTLSTLLRGLWRMQKVNMPGQKLNLMKPVLRCVN